MGDLENRLAHRRRHLVVHAFHVAVLHTIAAAAVLQCRHQHVAGRSDGRHRLEAVLERVLDAAVAAAFGQHHFKVVAAGCRLLPVDARGPRQPRGNDRLVVDVVQIVQYRKRIVSTQPLVVARCLALFDARVVGVRNDRGVRS